MVSRLVEMPNILTVKSVWKKYAIAALLVATPLIAQATPRDMGSFTTTEEGFVNGKWTAKGSYTASGTATGSSSWGTFTITRDEMNGYNNSVSFLPTLKSTGRNGIEIKNEENSSVDRDRFKYTFTITPNESTSIHTIKIGQASYTKTTGNSEIARNTLVFSQNTLINVPAQAIIKENLPVSYFYNAMGDYFMGSRINDTQLSSQATSDIKSGPQLRRDSSNTRSLYYYNIPSLTGAGNKNPYTPTLSQNTKEVRLDSIYGALPDNPTFEKIFKSLADNGNESYSALATNSSISNGGTFVSYGILNSDSNYVIEVKNAKSVTLTYEGIMNGNIYVTRPNFGETFSEWISFGVTTESYTTHKQTFSGTVFNDNGGINDSQANSNTIDGMYNNNQYFNGIFDTPTEKGIAGSTVTLVDRCVNPTQTYAKQTLTSTDANNIGKYQLSVLSSELKNQSSVCIIETYNGNTYPVQTTASNKLINLGTDNYDNHNFGRVIAANAALVLVKSQYVHDCGLTDLTTIDVNYNGLATVAFSKNSIDKIEPGQCIAYRIEAINRGNVPLTDIVIRDTLQKSGVNNAFATSTLAAPKPIGENSGVPTFATGSVAIGNNGMVITDGFILGINTPNNRKAIRFNTKYGSVVYQ